MYGEVESHFSSLKATGETRVKDKFRNLDHGDQVFLIACVEVNKISFPQDKDGLIERVHNAKASELYVISPEDAEKVMSQYREVEDGQGSIIAEIERHYEGTDED